MPRAKKPTKAARSEFLHVRLTRDQVEVAHDFLSKAAERGLLAGTRFDKRKLVRVRDNLAKALT